MISYFGLKSFLISTLNRFSGKSRTCPIEAITSYPGPKYFLMVFAFAGDSTITNFDIYLSTSFISYGTAAVPLRELHLPAQQRSYISMFYKSMLISKNGKVL